MKSFDVLLDLALSEDLGGTGDVTSRAVFSDQKSSAVLISKDNGILAGVPYFKKVFSRIDPDVSVVFKKSDGDTLTEGDQVAFISGLTVSILEAERTAINFISFLSGIATMSSGYVKAASSGRAVILDTRKTLPGYRELSKYAVAAGGAQNHRMGLYDMVMIKDNHIDAAGSITSAVERVREKWGSKYRIEVETRNTAEVQEAVNAGADIVMLDNMSSKECAEAVKMFAGKVLFEASGNMNLEKVREYSSVNVDFISVGALTHSVKAFDFSLRIVPDDR